LNDDSLKVSIFNTRDFNDETALARLGAAAILLWSQIPAEVSREIISLSSHVTGIRKVSDCEERLARLIESHRQCLGPKAKSDPPT
jgi:hypothetical protein